MPAPASKRRPHPGLHAGFDVVCTIGRVELGEDGEDSPHVAAFKLIAQHDTPGTFTFPMSDGGECAVTVEYSEPRGRDDNGTT